jgi:chromosomal replication initiator protein
VAIRRTLLDEQLRLGENDALVALKHAWDKALTLLEPEVNRPSFESFFKTAKPISVDGNSCCIGAASELARIFLEKYYHLVKPALEASLGVDMDVTFTVMPKEPPKARTQAARKPEPPVRNISSISQALNDKYTFQSFVTGASNKMACAAAKAVAENPGQAYNPFFLYGGPGLGKTHLLQAIAHQAMEKHPGIRVAYVSGEIFTSHYVTALQEKRSEDFRQKYRSIDLLLVDDIQFLAGRPQTKEEFFHTFNALYQMNKQIVLCSDRPPREIAPIEERLKSRFEAGLVADISPPDMKTRMAILTAKVKTNGADLPPATLECIADLIPTNVRALEGALITLMAYSSLMKVPLTDDLVRDVLSRYLTEKRCTEMSPDTIQRAVAQEFSVEVKDIRGEKRDKDLVLARHVGMYLTRELTDCSLQAIGKAFGGRNHASVVHARNRIASLLPENESLRTRVDNLAQGLKSGRLP